MVRRRRDRIGFEFLLALSSLFFLFFFHHFFQFFLTNGGLLSLGQLELFHFGDLFVLWSWHKFRWQILYTFILFVVFPSLSVEIITIRGGIKINGHFQECLLSLLADIFD